MVCFYDHDKSVLTNFRYDAQWHNSLPDNSINDIAEAANGVFWFATEDNSIAELKHLVQQV